MSLALSLLGIWKWVRGAFGQIVAAMMANPVWILVAALAAFGWWAWDGKGDAERAAGKAYALAQRATTLATGERASHIQTRARYARAQIDAANADLANLVRVERDYHLIIEEKTRELETLRYDYRRDVDRWLRDEAARTAAAAGSALGIADLSRVSALPTEPLRRPGTAVVPELDLYLCADAFAGYDALRTAWRAAAQVNVNGDPE